MLLTLCLYANLLPSIFSVLKVSLTFYGPNYFGPFSSPLELKSIVNQGHHSGMASNVRRWHLKFRESRCMSSQEIFTLVCLKNL